jgi:hypothetical protein
MATRYKSGNENLYIEEKQTTQWPQDTKGVIIVSSALLRYTDSDYPFGILWPLRRLLFFDIEIMITPLVSCGHCVVCSSSIYRFWLPIWYLVAIVSSAFLRYTGSHATVYQTGNHHLYIEEEQTKQWPQDIKGVIRICISKKSRRHNGHKIPKG